MYLQTYIKYLSAYAPSIFAKANVKNIPAIMNTNINFKIISIFGIRNIPNELTVKIKYIACLNDI